jgi:hypothetical protein
MVLVSLRTNGLRAPIERLHVAKEATWLGWNVEGMVAVDFDFNVPKLSTRTENQRIVMEEVHIMNLKLLKLAKIES